MRKLRQTGKQIFIALALAFLLSAPFFVFAVSPSSTSPIDRLQRVGAGPTGPFNPADANSLSKLIGTVVSVLLGLLGIIFIVLIIVGGFQWMTAGGNEESIKKAKSRIFSAVIGLVIVLAAYAIWTFVANYLL